MNETRTRADAGRSAGCLPDRSAIGQKGPHSDAASHSDAVTADVPADQAAFLNALVDLAEANVPDVGFAGRLEAQLRAEAERALGRQAVAVRRPRPQNTLQGIVSAAIATVAERMSNVNRGLVFSLAGAAVVAMILFAALAFFNQNNPVPGPSVAQAPTSTFVPTALPTPTAPQTALPATPTTAAAAQETRQPTAIPTETSLPPAPTPTPGNPIPLPALARWQETGGYGGGGMGRPIPIQKTFVLGAALPDGPEQMTVYLQREPEKLTAAVCGRDGRAAGRARACLPISTAGHRAQPGRRALPGIPGRRRSARGHV